MSCLNRSTAAMIIVATITQPAAQAKALGEFGGTPNRHTRPMRLANRRSTETTLHLPPSGPISAGFVVIVWTAQFQPNSVDVRLRSSRRTRAAAYGNDHGALPTLRRLQVNAEQSFMT